ncbi:MAG: thioester reductase domain-containing protein, partial [Cyanobacteria bacterium P01_G01_bin.54]
SEAVVIAREDRPGQKRLVGYAIASALTGQFASHSSTQERTLRQFLQDRLPSYLVPSAIVCLETFPLTPSGKVDRRNLPAPGQPIDRKFSPPSTDLEKALAHIWEAVLGVEQVGLDDNFFELGGDSLLATQAITRIRETLNREVSFLQFFETAKLEALAVWLSAESASPTPKILPLEPTTRNQPLPLTWMQEPLWFLDQLINKHPFYTVPEAFHLKGALSVQALAKSLQTVIDRHEPLRTTFEVAEGRPVQIIHETVECPFSVVDLSPLPEADRAREAQVQLVEAARAPFDLAQDVLLRATLFKLRETDHILLLNLHHIACDGWSMGVLMQELEQLYTAYEVAKPSPLPTLPVQYADFTLWHRQWLSSDLCEQQLAYWQQRLGEGLPKLTLPTDYPRPTMPTYEGGRQFISLPNPLTQALKALGKESGATLYMVLLAAFQTLLHQYSGQDDITVGSLLSNRPRPELEKLIGFFPNTVALRTDLTGALSFRTVLQRVRAVTLGAYAHQELPFAQIVQALSPNHRPGQNPFFDVIFNLQNTPVSDWQHPSLSLTHLNLENKTAKFDLFLELTEVETGLAGYFEYSTDLFKAQTIAEMSDRFVALLQSIVANPDQSIATNAVSAVIAQIKSGRQPIPITQTASRPSTSLEAKVANLWANILSVEQVGVNENFFDLGGHSLLATELLFSLQDTFEVELSLLNIFMAPTVAEQAKLICDRQAGNPLKPSTLDLQAEVVLADDIYPNTNIIANADTPEAVLLTGGTGFLGAFLLHEILRQTQANVYCLVRSKDAASAGQRLQTTLQRYGLWQPQQAHRIIPVMGDLSQPQLALSAEQFQSLAETVDIIYHNGAMVNFMYPYPVMKATNVSATEDILRLASRSKLKPVHFLSTQGVFSPIAYEPGQVIREQDEPAEPKGLYGYTQSKWVAEKLLAIAQSRGIPTMVYRPAWIEGHSETGICNRSDFLRSLIKGCIQLGVAPDWLMPIDLVPVDYISKGIVHLSLHQATGQAFNFANPQTILWNQLVDWMVTYGYRLQRMSYPDWLALVKSQVKPGSDSSLAPFLAFLTEPSPGSERTVPEIYFQTHTLQFDIQNLQQELANYAIAPYPTVIDMLPIYFDYFISSGFLEPPLKVTARYKAGAAMQIRR